MNREAAMAKEKRHPRVEIATRLAPANDLPTQGKLQSEIADRTRGEADKIAELELENSRLRQWVIDLMLEKLDEADRTGFPRSVH
jgi:hypothetical protein